MPDPFLPDSLHRFGDDKTARHLGNEIRARIKLELSPIVSDATPESHVQSAIEVGLHEYNFMGSFEDAVHMAKNVIHNGIFKKNPGDDHLSVQIDGVIFSYDLPLNDADYERVKDVITESAIEEEISQFTEEERRQIDEQHQKQYQAYALQRRTELYQLAESVATRTDLTDSEKCHHMACSVYTSTSGNIDAYGNPINRRQEYWQFYDEQKVESIQQRIVRAAVGLFD